MKVVPLSWEGNSTGCSNRWSEVSVRICESEVMMKVDLRRRSDERECWPWLRYSEAVWQRIKVSLSFGPIGPWPQHSRILYFASPPSAFAKSPKANPYLLDVRWLKACLLHWSKIRIVSKWRQVGLSSRNLHLKVVYPLEEKGCYPLLMSWSWIATPHHRHLHRCRIGGGLLSCSEGGSLVSHQSWLPRTDVEAVSGYSEMV